MPGWTMTKSGRPFRKYSTSLLTGELYSLISLPNLAVRSSKPPFPSTHPIILTTKYNFKKRLLRPLQQTPRVSSLRCHPDQTDRADHARSRHSGPRTDRRRHRGHLPVRFDAASVPRRAGRRSFGQGEGADEAPAVADAVQGQVRRRDVRPGVPCTCW